MKGLKVIHRRFKRFYGKQSGNKIWIDLSGSQLLKTMLHETLHAKHPKWSEARVQKETGRRWAKITDRGLVRLARLLGRVR